METKNEKDIVLDKEYFSLKKSAPIFKKLKEENPDWWKKICNDDKLYVNIRKGSSISVYYKGHIVVTELKYDKDGYSCKVNANFLGISNCDNKAILPNCAIEKIDLIKESIDNICNKKHKKKEGAGEEELKACLYCEEKYGDYIDTEYQCSDGENGLRIDLVRINDGGNIEFVELKRISDPRLRHKGREAEVIQQVENYSRIIEKYGDKFVDYYKKVKCIMEEIGIKNLPKHEVNGYLPKAKLLIADYRENPNISKRVKRWTEICQTLKKRDIECEKMSINIEHKEYVGGDNFRERGEGKHIQLLENKFFGEDQGNGKYDGGNYPHVLQCGKKNLFEEIRESAIGYFDAHGIPWHKGCKGCKTCKECKKCKGGPTGNTLSSQIACLNHLFAIRDDKEAVKALVQGINKKFVCVSPIPNAYDKKKNKKAEKQNKDNSENENKKVYISFEVVSDKDHLGEGTPTRGAKCTSIDALIYAKEKCSMGEAHERMCLIVIEWKYTEKFATNDKSREDSGETRMSRYNDLINCSKLLVHLSKDGCKYPENIKDYQGRIYYKETFYQLMRQTLWAEQVIKHRLSSTEEKKEPIEADDYLHLHVVPKGNEQLRTKQWKEPSKTKEPNKTKEPDKTMEETWKEMLTDEGKKRYKTIDPEELLAPIAQNPSDPKYKNDYTSLINYLRQRYWDRPTETTNNDNQNPSAK